MDGMGGDGWMADSHSAIVKCAYRKERSVGPPSL
jgi:hypothetical protein